MKKLTLCLIPALFFIQNTLNASTHLVSTALANETKLLALTEEIQSNSTQEILQNLDAYFAEKNLTNLNQISKEKLEKIESNLNKLVEEHVNEKFSATKDSLINNQMSDI